MLTNTIQKKSLFTNRIVPKDWQMNAMLQDGKRWSVLCMKAVHTDLGLETSVCGFKKAGAQRTLPFQPFLLKYAIAREKITSCNTYKEPSFIIRCSRQVGSYVRSSTHFCLNTDAREDYPKQARLARADHKNTHTQGRVLQRPGAWHSQLALFLRVV